MKRILLALTLIIMATTGHALTFWSNGVLYGTVCRIGIYFYSYPVSMAQPVGTMCPVRDSWGNIIATGTVTNEYLKGQGNLAF